MNGVNKSEVFKNIKADYQVTIGIKKIDIKRIVDENEGANWIVIAADENMLVLLKKKIASELCKNEDTRCHWNTRKICESDDIFLNTTDKNGEVVHGNSVPGKYFIGNGYTDTTISETVVYDLIVEDLRAASERLKQKEECTKNIIKVKVTAG